MSLIEKSKVELNVILSDRVRADEKKLGGRYYRTNTSLHIISGDHSQQ